MNKKLIAVAVAGAFAAPAAFAQSSVTISGYIKGGFESLKYGNSAKANASQSGVTDDSSQIQFSVREDLGGGLAAIAQMNMRFTNDAGAAISSSGNTHVGLQSKSWGRIFVGRQDLHYFNTESDMTTTGGPLRSSSIGILAYVSPAGGGTSQSIAGATRTPNVIHYTTPNWGGFTLIAAYSANAGAAAESDIGSGVRKGRAWNLNPNFAGANWQIGYSYWTSKPDGAPGAVATLATGDQRGDRLYGSYRFPMGFKIGLAWDKSRIKGRTLAGGDVGDIARRTAWSIPMSYKWGNHGIHAHFDKAGNDKTTDADDSASMFAISYQYDLSKRTTAGLTYARINNKGGAQYNLFTSSSLGLASAGGTNAIAAGEDPRMWGVTLRHAF